MSLRFPSTSDWLMLPDKRAREDLAGWAQECAAQLVPRRFDRAARAAAAEHLEAVGRYYLEVGGFAALFLVPGGRIPVRAMVRLELFRGPDTAEGFQAQCDAMIPPLDWLVDPVSVETKQTPAGPVTRFDIRFADPTVDPAPARQTVYWAWWFTDPPHTILASAAFADVTEGARWCDEVEREVLGAQRPGGAPAVDAQVRGGDYAGS